MSKNQKEIYDENKENEKDENIYNWKEEYLVEELLKIITNKNIFSSLNDKNGENKKRFYRI